MLKKIFAVFTLSACVFMVPPMKSEAGMERGKWIDVYDGNSMPIGAVCANSLFTKKCIIGDTRTYGASLGG